MPRQCLRELRRRCLPSASMVQTKPPALQALKRAAFGLVLVASQNRQHRSSSRRFVWVGSGHISIAIRLSESSMPSCVATIVRTNQRRLRDWFGLRVIPSSSKPRMKKKSMRLTIAQATIHPFRRKARMMKGVRHVHCVHIN